MGGGRKTQFQAVETWFQTGLQIGKKGVWRVPRKLIMKKTCGPEKVRPPKGPRSFGCQNFFYLKSIENYSPCNIIKTRKSPSFGDGTILKPVNILKGTNVGVAVYIVMNLRQIGSPSNANWMTTGLTNESSSEITMAVIWKTASYPAMQRRSISHSARRMYKIYSSTWRSLE